MKDWFLLLLASGFGLICFCLIILFARYLLRNRIMVEKRLEQLLSKNSNEKEEEAVHVKKKQRKESLKFLKKLKIIEALDLELSAAGILMRAEEFLIMWVIIIFVPSGLVVIMAKNVISATSLVIIGVILPLFLVNRFKKKRIEEFTVQLSDALITLGNCLRSGLSLIQGIESIGNEMADPIGKEFKMTYKEINYGVPVDIALNNLKKRVKSDELDLIVSAILIQREVGGNLSVILDNVSDTIKERLRIKGEIKILTATGRMSGYVVGFLPLGIGLILMLLSPGYMSAFFESSLGNGMLIAAAALEIIGFAIIKKIVTVKY